MIKNPFDLIIYEEILWELKPTVIIEIGNAFGGFTLWLQDRMRMICDNKVKVITIDLESVGHNNFKNTDSESVVSIVGNCNSDKVINNVKNNISKDDIVLIIEDSSHTFENTLQVLENYKDIVSVGSYLIVEDGICDILKLGISPGPMKAVEKWINTNESMYKIDRNREKYIMTYNPKGYLKRIC